MADMVVTLSGDEAKLWKAQQKIIEQQLAMEKGYSKVGDASSKSSKSIADSANAANSSLGQIGKSIKEMENAVGTVTNLAKSYDSVGIAVGIATEAIKAMIAKQNESFEIAMAMAGPQGTLLENLTAFSMADKRRIIEEVIPQVADSTGVSKRDLTTAAQDLAGVSDGNVEKFAEYLKIAAEASSQNPVNIGPMAAGGFQVGQISGLSAEESFKLASQAQNRTQTKEARTFLPKFIEGLTLSQNAHPDQNRVSLTEEGAAFMAAWQASQGQLTPAEAATGNKHVMGGLQEMFGNIPKARTEAANRLREQELALQNAELQLNQLDLDATNLGLTSESAKNDIRKADVGLKRFAKPPENPQLLAEYEALRLQKQKAELELQGLPIRSERINQQRQEAEFEKKKASEKIAELKPVDATLANLQDPKTLGGRLDVLRQNKGLQKQFLDSIGESADVMKQFFDPTSKFATAFDAGLKGINTESRAAMNLAESQTVTPEQRAAQREQKRLVQKDKLVGTPENLAFGEINREISGTLYDTGNASQNAIDFPLWYAMRAQNAFSGPDAAVEAGTTLYKDRIASFEAGGISPDERTRIDAMNASMRRLEEILKEFTTRTAEQNGELKKIAGNTGVMANQAPTNNAAAIQAQAKAGAP